ncbi:M23 family metallopeptidase [Microbacterium sp. J1-1]|uniref:M23 family metallopeptidase n=1 Tax=Microbacterium sp. J1-1 TaxID=2992441 RepID=UPI002115882B|nr:M23 family metallopeptidase [Microbacterium sp. J1-1]UUE19389.1 M23 family metallopeptidase [Microbacterium sp. J1-1]
MKKFALVALALLLLTPSISLIGVATLAGTSATAAVCTPGSLAVGPIPDSLTATTRNGETVTLNRTQLTRAATIITVGGQTSGVGRPGVQIALMAALTESTLRMLANTGAYPESGDYPNDGNGSDHDSLGLFQMRPASGWGTVADLMDPIYQARAFYGGPTGPNYPSPRGLLDIPGWQQLDPGEAAQAVEVSAYPDRYQNYQPVADAILTALTRPAPDSNGGGGGETPVVPEATRIVFPLPEGTWVRTSPFGWRSDPITGERRFHAGSDFAAADGTPIYAVADGVVVHANYTDGGGGVIIIDHTVRGERVASMYVHMWAHGIHVATGDTVTAGQHIGDVGSSGHSTGPHLHLQIHPGGAGHDAVDSDAWLTNHHAEGITGGESAPAMCTATGGGV